MTDKTPTIVEDAITIANSPFTVNLKEDQGHPIGGFIIVNTGSACFTVQQSTTGDAFGDVITIEPGDVYKINSRTEQANTPFLDRILITRGTADSSFKVIGSPGEVDFRLNVTKRIADDVELPFLDSLGSAKMNINVGFTGTPERIHDGADRAEWTFSNLTGTGFVESVTTHAAQGISTVIDFSLLSGDTVTIDGVGITNTTLTEGVEWTASTDNETTATSLASAINGVTGVTATASGAIVTVIIVNGSDITTLTSSNATNLPTTAQSIDATGTVDGNEMQLLDTGTTDMTNFSTLTGRIFITSFTNVGATKNIQLRFRNGSTDVGNLINLSDFIDSTTLNTWQTFAIVKSQFGVDTETVDNAVVKVIDTAPGVPPDFFLDLIQIEQNGSPVTFTLFIPTGGTFSINRIQLTGQVSGVGGSGTLPFVSPNEFFFIPKLPIGMNFRITVDGVTVESGKFRNNFDFSAEVGEEINISWDGSSVAKLSQNFLFGNGLKLIESRGDSFEMIVNDNHSSMDELKFNATGDLSF